MSVASFLKNTRINKAHRFLSSYLPSRLDIGIIFGSFLNKSIDFIPLKNKKELNFKEIPYMPIPSVLGHKNQLVYGELFGKKILIFGGRCHLYEGYSVQDVVYPIFILNKFLAKNIIITNSAGGINPKFCEDDIMIIKDHINLMLENPFFGYRYDINYDYFVDMSSPYSEKLIEIAKSASNKIGLDIKTGVYAGVKGPVLETKAEINMLYKVGADAVGMSTVPEVIMANYFNISVLGLSHITNIASSTHEPKLEKNTSGDKDNKFKHARGLDKEFYVGKMFAKLIEKILEKA